MAYQQENIFNYKANIVTPPPIEIDNIINLYETNIPKELPKIRREDIINDNNKHNINEGVIDEDYVKILLNQLQNLYREVPKYQMPPLINISNFNFNNDSIKQFTSSLFNENYVDDLFTRQEQLPPQQQQQQQQQQQLKPQQ